MVCNSDDDTNFPHKILLANRRVANLRKAFANYLSTNIKLSKTELFKMVQRGRFFGRLLGPLLKTGLPLMKSLIKPLAKSILIHQDQLQQQQQQMQEYIKKILGSGKHDNTTTLIISNDEMEGVIKIVKSLEDSSF